ncbi:MAG: purine nucleoside phosphorylase DeoD-type [Bacilli bacterium]
MTPHINAKKEEIAKTVLVSGDPKRIEYIALNYLDNPKLVNDIRGEKAYTGYYKTKEITLLSTGMGLSSAAIYSYELYKFYDVENIIRIGTCGTYTTHPLGTLLLAESSYSSTSYANEFIGLLTSNVTSSTKLNEIITKTSKELEFKLIPVKVHTTDAFYSECIDIDDIVNTTDCTATEMECFSIFLNAIVLKRNATAILSVTDNLKTNERLDSLSREQKLDEMITLALESCLKL